MTKSTPDRTRARPTESRATPARASVRAPASSPSLTRGPARVRCLHVVLGDQLDERSPRWKDFDSARDAIWLAEVEAESTHVPSHVTRIALFLSAMRHFAARQRELNRHVIYRQLEDEPRCTTLGEALEHTLRATRPEKIVLVEPGEFRVRQELHAVVKKLEVELDTWPDTHFLCTKAQFEAHVKNRKQLRLEFFYREMRQRNNVLMEKDDSGKPLGGQWNFDHDNRGSFGSEGPPLIPEPVRFEPDAITKDVIELVRRKYPRHPGNLDAQNALQHFDWPVTPEQAKQALDDFIHHRLPSFGLFQDAMWTGQTWLYHSRLSAAMNLKLLDPRDVIAAAERAYHDGHAPLPAVEGFIRQILGWREYVRGVYWHFMPEYLDRNALNATRDLPWFYWTADTDMNCLHHALTQTLQYGYAHHIQRLMVTGLFALMFGVHPQKVHEWYLAVYVDAVEWVELPNTLGMSQYADDGVMASKPYIATGKYIQRMSNYCDSCRYRPDRATGDDACPFTTLYWDFLQQHRDTLSRNPRMLMQVRNLARKTPTELVQIRVAADALRKRVLST